MAIPGTTPLPLPGVVLDDDGDGPGFERMLAVRGCRWKSGFEEEEVDGKLLVPLRWLQLKVCTRLKNLQTRKTVQTILVDEGHLYHELCEQQEHFLDTQYVEVPYLGAMPTKYKHLSWLFNFELQANSVDKGHFYNDPCVVEGNPGNNEQNLQTFATSYLRFRQVHRDVQCICQNSLVSSLVFAQNNLCLMEGQRIVQQCSRSSTAPYLDPSQDGDTNDPSEPEPMDLDEQHNGDNEEDNDGADQEDIEEHGGGYLGGNELGEDDDGEEGHFGDSDEEEIIVVVKTVADVQATAYSRSTTLKLHEEAEEPHNVVVRGRQRCFRFEMDETLMGVIRAHPYLQGLF